MERFLSSFFDLGVWARYTPEMVQGFGITLLLAAVIVASGMIAGVILAAARTYGVRPLNAAIVVLVDVLRAVPPLVSLVVAYFALPFVGVTLPGYVAAWLTLSLVLAAFVEEIVFGGIATVPRGQWDAARSLGISFSLALFGVVLPQALRMTLAPLTNRAIAMAKNTALASVIAVPELLNKATSAQAATANTTPLTMAAVGYLIMFVPLVIASRGLERRYPQQRSSGV